jgi:hypothetical protein
MERGNWDEAARLLKGLPPGYRDCGVKLSLAKVGIREREQQKSYMAGQSAANRADWPAALSAFQDAGSHKDATVQASHALKMNRKLRDEEEAQVAERIRKEREDHLRALVGNNPTAYSRLCRLKNEHPGWSDDVCATIAERKVQIGMTEDQATAAWGRPDDINRSVGKWGVHEQWVYGEYGRCYLYFENGVMTSFQN